MNVMKENKRVTNRERLKSDQIEDLMKNIDHRNTRPKTSQKQKCFESGKEK